MCRATPSIALIGLIALTCRAAESAPAPALELLPQQDARFISIAPVDDGGKTSGRHAITICLPNGYDASVRRYPVVYVLDGETAFQNRRLDLSQTMAFELAHDQLVHDKLIQPVIFVAIANSMDGNGGLLPGNRARDYLPMRPVKESGGFDQAKADAYYEFIAKTIKPFIDKSFRTRPEAAATCIAGMSYGGVGAFWMTWSHPETFGLGLCQTPSFWAIKDYLATQVDKHQGPLPAARFWLDAGSQEIDQWLGALDAYTRMLALGYRANVDVAFQTGHAQVHAPFDAAQRLRSALYFLFRDTPPQFTGAEIVDIDATAPGAIRLSRPTRAALELTYDGWFRITDATRSFTIADAGIVDHGDAPGSLVPKALGATTIATTYGGAAVSQAVTVVQPEASYACPRTARAITIDGDLSDWTALPFRVERPQAHDPAPGWQGAADCSYRFGCAYDDDHVYIGVETVDDRVVSVAGKDPWTQDGVEVRLDARPEPKRTFGRGQGEFAEVLLLAISPTLSGESPGRLPFAADKLPPGTRVVCVQTSTGHNTEIAIPAAYLKSACGGQDWSAFRLNVDVNDRNDPSETYITKMWWQPDWRSLFNQRGSGTFARQ